MQTENLSIDDVIIKTTEALIGAGLKSNSAWGHYHKFYVMLSRYQHSIDIAGYDLGAIDSFMKKQEDRCHAGEISARELRHADTEQKRRAIELAENSNSPAQKNPSAGKYTVSDEATLKKLYGLR